MTPNLLEREFTVSDAAKVADIDVETLRTWLKRGKLEISSEKGKWTRFRFADLCKVAVFANILAANGDHTLAFAVASNSGEQFEKIYSEWDDASENGFIPYALIGRGSDGEHFFEIANGVEQLKSEIDTLVSKGVPVWFVVDYGTVLFNIYKRLDLLAR